MLPISTIGVHVGDAVGVGVPPAGVPGIVISIWKGLMPWKLTVRGYVPGVTLFGKVADIWVPC